jgi:hypothetical protein
MTVDAMTVHVETEPTVLVIDNRSDTIEGGKRLALRALAFVRLWERVERFYEEEGV